MGSYFIKTGSVGKKNWGTRYGVLRTGAGLFRISDRMYESIASGGRVEETCFFTILESCRVKGPALFGICFVLFSVFAFPFLQD
jgi:hypothetical protein